jgi:hypothetical protein
MVDDGRGKLLIRYVIQTGSGSTLAPTEVLSSRFKVTTDLYLVPRLTL